MSSKDDKSRQRYRATLERHKKRTTYLRKFNASKSFTPQFLDLRSVWSDDSTVACGRREKGTFGDDGSATTGSASFSSTKIDDDSLPGQNNTLPLFREFSSSVKGLFQMDFSGNDEADSRQGGDSLLRDEDFVWYENPRDSLPYNKNSRSFDTLDLSADGVSNSTYEGIVPAVRISSFTNISRVRLFDFHFPSSHDSVS